MNNKFKIGDVVSRKKYGNDILFKIDKIVGNKVFLKGLEIRLYADANIEDISLSGIPKKKEEITSLRNLNTNDYFYIPGKILHIDSDKEYLNRCLDYYKKQKLSANGYIFRENDMSANIEKLVKKHKPNILVITGHDAYYKNKKNGKNYMNSSYYKDCVKTARNIEPNHEHLIIISGACQSDFEGLIKSGSTFASSPKHINIHALDPAIIASYVSLSEKNKLIDIKDALEKTKYGYGGIGGLDVCGMMIKGYPRKE